MTVILYNCVVSEWPTPLYENVSSDIHSTGDVNKILELYEVFATLTQEQYRVVASTHVELMSGLVDC